jgi:ABC-type transport system involved in multi-copper enzyme maturation permease subunit
MNQPATLPRNDFPDWISPMLVKELRQGMRTKVFVFSFILLQVLMTLNVVIGLLSTANGMNAEVANALFWVMVGVPVVLVLPFLGLGALSGEKAANTLELIFLTRLSAWRIVLGKWFAIVAQIALFACAVLPYAVLRYFMGEVNLSVDIFLLCIMLFGSAVFTAITVGLSPFQTRVTRTFTIIGFFLLAYFLLAMLSGPMFGGSGIFSGASPLEAWRHWLTALLFGSLLVVLMLQIAASRIAPEAENHSAAKRIVGLGFLVTTIGMIALGAEPRSTIGFAIICCVPLFIGAVCDPLHWNQAVYRPFVRLGLPGRLMGRLLYPGWPAGILFALGLLLAFGALLWFHKFFDDDERILGFVALLGTVFFPAAVTRLFFRRTETPFPFFIGMVAICAVFTILANVLDNIFETDMRTFICVLPPCAFIQELLGLIENDQVGASLVLCAGGTMISLVVVFACAWSQWKRIRAIEKEIAASANEPVA